MNGALLACSLALFALSSGSLTTTQDVFLETTKDPNQDVFSEKSTSDTPELFLDQSSSTSEEPDLFETGSTTDEPSDVFDTSSSSTIDPGLFEESSTEEVGGTLDAISSTDIDDFFSTDDETDVPLSSTDEPGDIFGMSSTEEIDATFDAESSTDEAEDIFEGSSTEEPDATFDADSSTEEPDETFEGSSSSSTIDPDLFEESSTEEVGGTLDATSSTELSEFFNTTDEEDSSVFSSTTDEPEDIFEGSSTEETDATLDALSSTNEPDEIFESSTTNDPGSLDQSSTEEPDEIFESSSSSSTTEDPGLLEQSSTEETDDNLDEVSTTESFDSGNETTSTTNEPTDLFEQSSTEEPQVTDDVDTAMPTESPSMYPTVNPIESVTQSPTFTQNPSFSPTMSTFSPSMGPSGFPTLEPTTNPTLTPTQFPSANPTATDNPTVSPTTNTDAPSMNPSFFPTEFPTKNPTMTNSPSLFPTMETSFPSMSPSGFPTEDPTSNPSQTPTLAPTDATAAPSNTPSNGPSMSPTLDTAFPSQNPTAQPTSAPSQSTAAPSESPSASPSGSPTQGTDAPSMNPTGFPTSSPSGTTYAPSDAPTATPTDNPTQLPTQSPTDATDAPSSSPSQFPSLFPSEFPTLTPSNFPSLSPTGFPTIEGTTALPTTAIPTDHPTGMPIEEPTAGPTVTPTQLPSEYPTLTPTQLPSMSPTPRPSQSPTETAESDQVTIRFNRLITRIRGDSLEFGAYSKLVVVWDVQVGSNLELVDVDPFKFFVNGTNLKESEFSDSVTLSGQIVDQDNDDYTQYLFKVVIQGVRSSFDGYCLDFDDKLELIRSWLFQPGMDYLFTLSVSTVDRDDETESVVASTVTLPRFNQGPCSLFGTQDQTSDNLTVGDKFYVGCASSSSWTSDYTDDLEFGVYKDAFFLNDGDSLADNNRNILGTAKSDGTNSTFVVIARDKVKRGIECIRFPHQWALKVNVTINFDVDDFTLEEAYTFADYFDREQSNDVISTIATTNVSDLTVADVFDELTTLIELTTEAQTLNGSVANEVFEDFMLGRLRVFVENVEDEYDDDEIDSGISVENSQTADLFLQFLYQSQESINSLLVSGESESESDEDSFNVIGQLASDMAAFAVNAALRGCIKGERYSFGSSPMRSDSSNSQSELRAAGCCGTLCSSEAASLGVIIGGDLTEADSEEDEDNFISSDSDSELNVVISTQSFNIRQPKRVIPGWNINSRTVNLDVYDPSDTQVISDNNDSTFDLDNANGNSDAFFLGGKRDLLSILSGKSAALTINEECTLDLYVVDVPSNTDLSEVEDGAIQCSYWNTSSSSWDEEAECVVANHTSSETTCICTQIGSIVTGIKSDFNIKVNSPYKMYDTRELNSKNIAKYPLTLIVVCLTLGVLLLTGLFFPECGVTHTPALAMPNLYNKDIWDHRVSNDKIAQEMRAINRVLTDGKVHTCCADTCGDSVCAIAWNLWMDVYLKTDHILFGICCNRIHGTNLLPSMRIAILNVYLFSLLFAEALFYGRSSPFAQEIFAVIIISILSTIPTQLIRKLFGWSVPIEKEWTDPDIEKRRKKAEEMIERKVTDNDRAVNNELANVLKKRRNTETTEQPRKASSKVDPELEVEVGVAIPAGGRGRFASHVPDEGYASTTPGGPMDFSSGAATGAPSALLASDPPAPMQQDKNRFGTLNGHLDTIQSGWNPPNIGIIKEAERSAQFRTQDQRELYSVIRKKLLKSEFPLPHWCIYVAWLLCLLWVGFTGYLAVSYGIQFDIDWDADEGDNGQGAAFLADRPQQCWDLSEEYRAVYAERVDMAKNRNDFNDEQTSSIPGSNESIKWLISVVLSLAFSVLIWQPLLLYLQSLIRAWNFTHRRQLTNGPIDSCFCCCNVIFRANRWCCDCCDHPPIQALNGDSSTTIGDDWMKDDGGVKEILNDRTLLMLPQLFFAYEELLFDPDKQGGAALQSQAAPIGGDSSRASAGGGAGRASSKKSDDAVQAGREKVTPVVSVNSDNDSGLKPDTTEFVSDSDDAGPSLAAIEDAFGGDDIAPASAAADDDDKPAPIKSTNPFISSAGSESKDTPEPPAQEIELFPVNPANPFVGLDTTPQGEDDHGDDIRAARLQQQADIFDLL